MKTDFSVFKIKNKKKILEILSDEWLRMLVILQPYYQSF